MGKPMSSFCDDRAEFERRKRLQAEVLESVKRFRVGRRLKRDEGHLRDAARNKGNVFEPAR
jgi:hypothetical protein